VIGLYIARETPQAAIRNIRLAFWKYLDGQDVAYLELTAITQRADLTTSASERNCGG